LNSTTPPPDRASSRIKPCNLLPTEASPEKKTKKQQEDADRAMKELSEQAALRDVHEKARTMMRQEELCALPLLTPSLNFWRGRKRTLPLPANDVQRAPPKG
jgi:hypothetical protein